MCALVYGCGGCVFTSSKNRYRAQRKKNHTSNIVESTELRETIFLALYSWAAMLANKSVHILKTLISYAHPGPDPAHFVRLSVHRIRTHQMKRKLAVLMKYSKDGRNGSSAIPRKSTLIFSFSSAKSAASRCGANNTYGALLFFLNEPIVLCQSYITYQTLAAAFQFHDMPHGGLTSLTLPNKWAQIWEALDFTYGCTINLEHARRNDICCNSRPIIMGCQPAAASFRPCWIQFLHCILIFMWHGLLRTLFPIILTEIVGLG